IIVTCSPEKVPQPLIDQLRDGGLMVIPVGERYQQTLYLMRKAGGELQSEALRPTLFVPMTGEAESRRELKPDPKNPQLVNGSFEEVIEGDRGEKQPAAWHYQRQLVLSSGADAPHAEHYATFRNEQPGRGAHALQGFAIDGRQVPQLALAFWIKGENIRPGAQNDEWPRVVVTFYDERRATLDEEAIGPFIGTFDWREETAELRVPLLAREAIIRIGLLGAVGELSLDDLRLRAKEKGVVSK
ncbi:MAG: protein-L-isoaspartate(D-aspartate) O-methyltransferase, partial [Pirellulales bacterium]